MRSMLRYGVVILSLLLLWTPAWAEDHQDARHFIDAGNERYAASDYLEAAKAYRKATDLDPEGSMAYATLGMMTQTLPYVLSIRVLNYAHQGKCTEALAEYARLKAMSTAFHLHCACGMPCRSSSISPVTPSAV